MSECVYCRISLLGTHRTLAWTHARSPPPPSPCDEYNRTANRTACEASTQCRWTELTSTCATLPVDDVSDVCEKAVFGYPPFCNGSSTPCSVQETEPRPVYVAFNLRKVDIGNPLFGALSAVFSDYLRPVSFVAPIDTGCVILFADVVVSVSVLMTTT